MTDDGPHDRVALVTGASRGLGAVLAQFLARQGYSVIVNARNREALSTATAEIAESGGFVFPVPGDVSDPETQDALAKAVSRWGHLELLINNASELGPSPLPELSALAPADLERILRVNVLAPLTLTQRLLPALRKGRGRIVNISSDAAVGGYPGWGGYGASKAALDLLSLTMAHELTGSPISVVSVDPGDMRTEMHQAAYPGQDISDRPLPEITLPFWAWLLNQDPAQLSGHRFRAQSDRWEVPEP
ncbi:MAG TPA: SDR family oxidoreductase [Thermoplasmata archaeon]|nr:SDR family oxidoreductase [Thermoplasmata archaeon]